MKPKLPYWVSPCRFGSDENGPYIAVDVAKSHKEPKTTLHFAISGMENKTPQERSKIVALGVHEKAKELGFIPKEWALK